jgi:cysteinyl-tRNA synthetase
MSERYLGQVFDIHAGGLDLIFPHHENEIAQSRCAHGTRAMANYWVHNGFLQVEGQKMSKSVGNFITIHELLETEKFGGRRWDGNVLRIAMLMTHYREPIDFSVVRLQEAEKRLRKWRSMSAMLSDAQFSAPDGEVIKALLDDLNSTKAFARLDSMSGGARTDDRVLLMASTLRFLGLQQSAEEAVVLVHEFAKGVNYRFQYYMRDPIEDRAELDAFYNVWQRIDVNRAIDTRLAALNARDFAAADAIRADLLTQGIQLMDYKDEQGQRQTKWEVKQ